MRLIVDLIIPFEVPSQNVTERRHWSRRAKEKKSVLWMLRGALPSGCRPHDGKKRVVEITAYRRRRIRDHANLVGGCKTLVDALVTVGLLVDDSEQWATFDYRQDVLSAYGFDRPMTIIRITDPETP